MKPCHRGCGVPHPGGKCPRDVSAVDDSLDSMVQAASVPNLASLFRKAKETGAIDADAGTVYGTGAA
jgi:hypothetical protein